MITPGVSSGVKGVRRREYAAGETYVEYIVGRKLVAWSLCEA
jgi:hypothetical protein